MADNTLDEPIVIWGAGAIGGTIGAYWARAGIDVILVDTARDHVRGVPHVRARDRGADREFLTGGPRRNAGRIDGPVRPYRSCRQSASHARRSGCARASPARRRLCSVGPERPQRDHHRADDRRSADDRLLQRNSARIGSARAVSCSATEGPWWSVRSTARSGSAPGPCSIS